MKNLMVAAMPKSHFDALYMNVAYHSKETILFSYSSFIIPSGSPLQANNELINSKFLMWMHEHLH